MPIASVKDLNFWGLNLDTARHISVEDYDSLVRQGCKPLVGDVLIAKDGNSALDTVCVVEEPLDVVLLSSVAILRPDPSLIDAKYLKYYFMSPVNIDYLKSNFISGAAIPRVILRDFKQAVISLPDIGTQKAIAHILGTLDDKIENNRKTAKTLEAMAQAIFQSWFVDFDPVRAKMNGESRESICKRLKLTPEILDLFPDRLVESELGEIPEGWDVAPISDFGDIVGGSTPSTAETSYWNPGVHHWATPKDLSKLSVPILLTTENTISDFGLQQISSRLLPAGTVLLSSRAPIGYLAITEIPVAINQGFIATKPHNPENCSFIMLIIKHNMDEIISRANGSTFLEISKTKFRPIPVVSPAQDLLQSFAKLTMQLFSRIVSLEKITRLLAVQRNTLLSPLISGEIRVPEAESRKPHGSHRRINHATR